MRKNPQQKNVLDQSSSSFGLVENEVNLLLQNAATTAPTLPIPQNMGGVGSPSAQSLPRVDGNQQNKPKFKNDAARDTLGPKIKEAQGNGWGYEMKNFLTNHKGILPLLLGIAAAALVGVFAMNMLMSGQETGTRTTTGTTEATGVASSTTASNFTTSPPTTNTNQGASATFVQKATSGDGVTHLARRTVATYLTETGYTLNAQQKVYAEDYLKDITGSFALSIGQEVSFDRTDVETAYTLSLELADWQIENLTQYTF